ncbi:Lipid III flippase [Ralstonia mannitolilytica]|uniref:oligosaccharide flippase family protein n=1 Tax=Ralstonia mannitolilytica TaxID=105219 RepID=UPI0028F5B1B8|nr:oligosaccharide flippase family protein [Ralstonia mannitolilytica]CAJ0889058.1 Lipid III flippase [Ralstonia mannitolilytica]
MRDLRAIGYLAAGTLVRAAGGLATAKIVAISVSLKEFGQLSQFMALVAFVGMFAAGGIAPGVTRVIAASGAGTQQVSWYATILRVYTATTAMIALLAVTLSMPLSQWIFGTDQYAWTIAALGCTQALVGLGNIYQAAAAAHGNYRVIFFSNAVGVAGGIVVLAVLAYRWGYAGAALGVVLLPAGPGLAIALAKVRSVGALAAVHCSAVDLKKIVHLFSFSAITLAGAASIILAQMAVRNLIGNSVGWEAVGFWQSTIRISDVYMQFVSVILMNYALPRLARSQIHALGAEFLSIVKKILFLFAVGGASLWLLRRFVYETLYSPDFVDATALLAPQVIGDAFRVVAVCFSVLFMSRSRMRIPVMYEMAQGIFFYLGTFLIVSYLGGAAPVYAYCLTYFLLSILLAFAYRARIGFAKT